MTDSDRLTELLLDVYGGLPRQGPGDDASSQRALELCGDLPIAPDVLDVGCGPGMQTVLLAQATGGTVTAVDRHEQFLEVEAQEAADGQGEGEIDDGDDRAEYEEEGRVEEDADEVGGETEGEEEE